ncbi:MAG: SanA/YdcF family protein, partial [Spirochaetota bacterium]
NNTPDYNEPIAMLKYAVKKGVPAEDISPDYAGFRTYDSIYRARDVFKVKSAILVTQKYHLFRALYIADNFGIQSEGIVSNKRRYLKEDWYETREFLAIILSFIEVHITKPKPKFLGEPIPILKD